MTVTLRIISFHNCDGCSQKVERALRKIGVDLVVLDRESGIVTVSTVESPEVIRRELARQLKKSVVVLSQELVSRQNQNPDHAVSRRTPANGSLDFRELGQAALGLAPFLNGVEITHSNTMRIDFNHRDNYRPVVRPEHGGYIGVRVRDAEDGYAPPRPPPRSPPWAVTEPSAPLIPNEEHVVYGIPVPEYHGRSTTRHHDDHTGCCNIL